MEYDDQACTSKEGYTSRAYEGALSQGLETLAKTGQNSTGMLREKTLRLSAKKIMADLPLVISLPLAIYFGIIVVSFLIFVLFHRKT